MSDIEDEPPSVLLPCAICSRTFRPEVLERHVKVCEKTASKKRRVFDSFKSRVSGTELEEFLGPAPLPGQAPRRPCKSPVKKRTPSKWKETHANLIATLRAARGVEPPADTMLEAPKPAGNERCPSCSRYFGPRAFDRHVEFCKEKTARIKLTPSKVSQAQERLEARTKYRAPLSIKPKLTTKEKYSPMPTRKESSENFSISSSSTKTSPPIPTISRNLKPGKQNSNSFSRQSPSRQSERQRSISPLKKNVTSSSKSNAKSEPQQKPQNQPKLKESLRSPEDLKPKPGNRSSTQEKIRISNPKQSQFEGESQRQLKNQKRKSNEKETPKSPSPSDDESNGTNDSEISEIREKHFKRRQSKWSSSESLSKGKEKGKKKVLQENEKISLDLTNLETSKTKSREELKSGRKSKQQKPQINDLSVNDESFGIFVAACTIRPSSSSASKTSLKTVKESPRKKNVISKIEEKQIPEKKMRQHSVKRVMQEVENVAENINAEEEVRMGKEGRGNKLEKISKIPKPKFEKKVEKLKYVEIEPEFISHEETAIETLSENEENKISREEEIKIKSRKWRNITDIPTEELVHLSKDFELPENDEVQQLSESAIWEIAGEQFLQSGEHNQSNSAFSVDSLNENLEEKNCEREPCKKISPKEDDLIILHVTDPAKLVENDADMKLSVSEPCFPRPDNFHSLKEKKLDSKTVDIVVFTASPNAIQPKISHRKRRRQRKTRKCTLPELSHIREKTFLANDIPKTKRQKTSNKSNWPPRTFDFVDDYFGTPTKEELEEKKKRFIEGLKNQWQKIRKWQIRADSHMRFVEEFQKSIEDDLNELKSLSMGKAKKSRPCLKEYKKEKIKEIRNKLNTRKSTNEGKKIKSKEKKFEYFEINLTGDIDCEVEEENPYGQTTVFTNPEEISLPSSAVENSAMNNQHQNTTKKFECFEIVNDNLEYKPEKTEGKHKGKTNVRKEITGKNSTGERSTLDSVQKIARQNSSLENIEEVDETVETGNVSEKDIEIEDFILSKPNTQKIFTKKDNCLEELFPRPRKIAEVVTSAKSKTAVELGFTANSVYDLKSNKEPKLKVLPQTPGRSNSKRMLQKRIKKESQLPQILVKNSELKENSMMSLIEAWKNKKETHGNKENPYKSKETLPSGKLPPLTNKNSFQIAALPSALKKILMETIKERFLDGTDANDTYDPFKQAERQMMALLSWPSTADIKTAKSISPTSKTKPSSQQNSNLETSPTSAFTKYPNKDDKPTRNGKTNARRNLNETFAMNEKNTSNEKPAYTAADDWEQIFEKHFDLNRNEMTEQVTRSVKSALDGLLKSSMKNKSDSADEKFSPPTVKNEVTQNSFIADVLYTSTPKQNLKSEKNSKTRNKNPVDLDETPTTYRKNSEFIYESITPPEDFAESFAKDKKNEKTNRNSGISLSSLSFCSQISDTTLADEEVMRSNLEIIGKAAAAATARTPRRKYARSQSVFDERNKMLFAKTYDPNCTSSDENDVEVLTKIVDKQGKVSPSLNPNHKPAPSRFYRSQSVVDDRCKGDGIHSEDASSPESNRNRKAKMSGDSAYSSLNRRSPRQNVQRNQHEDRLSSSGSEHSIPTVSDFEMKPKCLDFDSMATSKKDQPVKMSKFCHECGSKYPVAVAKFCCECGVRRLII